MHAHPVAAGVLGQLIADRLLDFFFEAAQNFSPTGSGAAARDVDVDLSGGVLRSAVGGPNRRRSRRDDKRHHSCRDYESRNSQDGCRLTNSVGAGKRPVPGARTEATRIESTQIAPRARSSAISAASYPRALSTASVCSPFSGVGVRNSQGVRLRFTAWPSSTWRPCAGPSIARAMPPWTTCGSANTWSMR